MTMPTTAMGICAYCSCPKTRIQRAIFAKHIVDGRHGCHQAEIWDKKLEMPSVSIRPHSFPLSAKSLLVGRMILICCRYQIARTAVTTCPSTVATAAPIIPHLHTKIKMGSRMILMTAPASVEIIANFGLPSARMMGFIACPNI